MLGNRTRLAQYRLEEKIGAGGMGEVWRATDTTLEKGMGAARQQIAALPDRCA